MKHDQASRTARLVSNGLYWVSQHARLGVEVPEEMLRYTTEMTRRIESGGRFLGTSIARWLLLRKCGIVQALSIPGLYLHQVLRKRYIESVARTALAGDTKQLVVIGAGFDTLSLRLSVALPECRMIEIDHPATQKAKTAALGEFELLTGSCHFLPADLSTESLASALARCPAYDSHSATLFIAEGLTMYLDEANIRALLEGVLSQAAGSELVFTYMDESSPGKFDFQNERIATSWWLALCGERFTWGVREAELPGFLEGSGFRLREHRTPEQMRVAMLTEANRNAVIALGENTAWATPVSLG